MIQQSLKQSFLIISIAIIWRNKTKWRISKWVFQENKAGQIFRKANISFPLKCASTCAYQGVRNVGFSENLACFVFLKHTFSDLPFCLITVDFSFVKKYNWQILKTCIKLQEQANQSQKLKQRQLHYTSIILQGNSYKIKKPLYTCCGTPERELQTGHGACKHDSEHQNNIRKLSGNNTVPGLKQETAAK